jgi:acetylornithine/N-succinyldiaminopimelate aminotransferase
LFDQNGKKYLDFVAGIATCAIGHGNAKLAAKVNDQMLKTHHVSNLFYTEPGYRLSKYLVDNTPTTYDLDQGSNGQGWKVFYCNSGAEAAEGALKLARRSAHNRGVTDPIIIAFDSSFHGRTLGALSATIQKKYHKGFGFGSKGSGFKTVMPGFASTKFNDEEGLTKLFKKMNRTPFHLWIRGRKRRVAGIIVEPLQGEGGIIPGTTSFMKQARKLCDSEGSLLIFDEVQVGIGRSGKFWGHMYFDGIVPDVITMAKGLGGGIPIGAMMAGRKCMDVFGPGDHASTFGGNPLACAAGLAVAEEMVEKDILKNVNERSTQIIDGVEKIKAKYPQVIKEIRGWGLLLGFEIVEESGLVASDITQSCMSKGLLLVGAGLKVVRFVPPLNVKKGEVDDMLVILEKGIADAWAKKQKEREEKVGI